PVPSRSSAIGLTAPAGWSGPRCCGTASGTAGAACSAAATATPPRPPFAPPGSSPARGGRPGSSSTRPGTSAPAEPRLSATFDVFPGYRKHVKRRTQRSGRRLRPGAGRGGGSDPAPVGAPAAPDATLGVEPRRGTDVIDGDLLAVGADPRPEALVARLHGAAARL